MPLATSEAEKCDRAVQPKPIIKVVDFDERTIKSTSFNEETCVLVGPTNSLVPPRPVRYPACRKMPSRVVVLDEASVQRKADFETLLLNLMQGHFALALLGSILWCIFGAFIPIVAIKTSASSSRSQWLYWLVSAAAYVAVALVVWQWICMFVIGYSRFRFSRITKKLLHLTGKISSADIKYLRIFNSMATGVFLLALGTSFEGMFSIIRIHSVEFQTEEKSSMFRVVYIFCTTKVVYGLFVAVINAHVFSKQITYFLRRRELAVALSQLAYKH